MMSSSDDQSLQDQAVQFVLDSRGRWRELRQALEGRYQVKVSESWLGKLTRGEMADPGVNKIEAILRYRDELRSDAPDDQVRQSA